MDPAVKDAPEFPTVPAPTVDQEGLGKLRAQVSAVLCEHSPPCPACSQEINAIMEYVSEAVALSIQRAPIDYRPDLPVAEAVRTHEERPFVGDKVEKTTGYKWPGVVVAKFLTLAGERRYVVECTVPEVAGALHIYSPQQLAPGSAGKQGAPSLSVEQRRQVKEIRRAWSNAQPGAGYVALTDIGALLAIIESISETSP